ncbi:MAG: metal-dependent hydrolase [Solirubrobacterales bacterium]
MIPLLVGLILGLDLLWAVIVGSTGSIAYGLIDEPAHLATCALALLALAALLDRRLSGAFVAAALLASVAIDADHIPGYLGSGLMDGGMSRPFTHGALLAGACVLAACTCSRPRGRQICFGLAFGVSAHLLRDVATGPGVALLWPLSDGLARVPYEAFALVLVMLGAVGMGFGGRRSARLRVRPGVAVSIGLLAILAATAVAPRPAEAYRVSVGGYIEGADSNPRLIESYARELGRQPAIVMSYKNWDQAPFVYDQLDGIWSTGAMPMVTWEAWDFYGSGVSLWGIATGHHDRYLREAARAAAGWNRPLMVRFGQEMNAAWFPWGDQPRAFKAAWRQIVRIFRQEGASNVRWVWTPYVNTGGNLPFERYYPGARWVDWVGLDGINWGGSFRWVSFGRAFNSSYRQLLAISSEPMMLAETGSGESGGHKGRWLSSMLRRVVPRMQHIRAILFWSVADRRGDIRVDSSAAALGSLQQALRMPLYDSSRATVTHAPTSLGQRRERPAGTAPAGE